MVFEKLLGALDAGDVLDVGCGSGQFTEILVSSLGSYRSVTGVDTDAGSLLEAGQKFPGDRFRFVRIRGNELPFEESAFDMAVISKALHHLEDPAGMLREMNRVLRPGGYLLINEMHRNELTPDQESHKLYHHLRSEIDRMKGICHNQTFLREEILGMFNAIPLNDRIVTEYIPDTGPANDPDNIEGYIRKMEGWMHELDGHPLRGSLEERIGLLKDRFQKYGISRPPQFVLMGRK